MSLQANSQSSTRSAAVAFTHAGTLSELEVLRPSWEQLLAACPDASPFHGPDWLIPWTRHLATGTPWVVAAWQGERLVGLVPFMLTDGPAGPTLRLLGTGVSDYGGMLVAPGPDGAGVAVLLLRAMAARRDWELAELEQLAPADPLRLAPLPLDLLEDNEPQQVCPVRPLAATVEELARVIPHALGPRMERTLAHLGRRHRVAFVHADAQNLDGLMIALFRLHGARWSARHGSGIFAIAQVRAFHSEVARGMLARRRLRLHVLLVDDEPAAVLYGFVHGARLHYYISGFAPAFAAHSPGSLVIWRAMTAAVAEGLTEVDFLRGAEPYKYRWGAHDRWNWRRRIVRTR